jgi:hypothetical protein
LKFGRTSTLKRGLCWRRSGRVPTPSGHELNYLSPSADTPGATLPCVRRAFLQTPNGPVSCRVGVGNGTFLYALSGEALSIAGDSLPSLGLSRISLRRNDPWQDATQDCAESLGSIASIIGVRHPIRMESVDGKVWSEE